MKHLLLIREEDKKFFEAIKSGLKTIETRAATEKYRKIKPGDTLIFVCGKEKLEKRVIKFELFKSVEEIFNTTDFKKIMPFANSLEEMKTVYLNFPGYKEKIKNHGLIAFFLT